MRWAYLGNFQPPHSTENDVARALGNVGQAVALYQEGDPDEIEKLVANLDSYEVVLWTRTKGLADMVGDAAQWKLLAEARRLGTPVVGYHLDRWWGLDREHQIFTDPFFRVDLLCTADGGHDAEWKAAGVNHIWFAAAISEANVGLGTPRDEYRSDIAFVGSWQGGYHREWEHRSVLVRWLKATYGARVKFWPRPGEHAVRGDDLKDLYASVKVVVGDSCLVPAKDGLPITRYCSDRIPETLGRGGLLVHPQVEGIDNLYLYTWEWPVGEWRILADRINSLLDGRVWRDPAVNYDYEEYISQQVQFIRERHTYEVRMQGLIELIEDML